MASMTDVARLAGVSVSTVSLVCNNKGYVSDEMRERVRAAMRELGYAPSTKQEKNVWKLLVLLF